MASPDYMLDSSVCIAILRNHPRLGGIPPTGECCLSRIVAAELWTGAEKSSRPEMARAEVGDFLGQFPVLDFDDSASRAYGEIRAALEKRGMSIGPLDLLIAAHARCAAVTLVTGNVKEFRRVPGLKVLRWQASPA